MIDLLYIRKTGNAAGENSLAGGIIEAQSGPGPAHTGAPENIRTGRSRAF